MFSLSVEFGFEVKSESLDLNILESEPGEFGSNRVSRAELPSGVETST